MPGLDLTALADAGAFVSREHQEHLAGAFAMRDLAVDPAAGVVTFAGPDGERTAWRAHLVGTAAPEDGTWLWGWRNINDFPDPFVRQSRRLRGFGEKHAVPDLATAQLALTDDLPAQLVRAAKALTGITAHVAAPTGQGATRAWLLVDDEALRLPEPTVARTVGVLMGGLATGTVHDHRRALAAWAEQRSAVLEADGDRLVRVHVSDGTVRVRFGEDDRISGIRTGRGEPEVEPTVAPAAEEPPADEASDAAAADPAPDVLPTLRRNLLARLLGR